MPNTTMTTTTPAAHFGDEILNLLVTNEVECESCGTVINRSEAVLLRRIVALTDPSAFVFANKVYEVLGEGFTPHGK